MKRRISRSLIGLGAAAILASAPVAQAAPDRLIRDAEIEATLRAYADPIFEAAGLDAEAVQVHIIRSDRIGVLIGNDLQVFILTGLLQRAETPNQVIGVIAHETGHIMGGHLIRYRETFERASIAAIVNALDGEGGHTAGMTIRRDLVRFSQAQEAMADQAALRLLEETRQSPSGMVWFLRVLAQQQPASAGERSPYLRSHPLTQDRVDAAVSTLADATYAAAVDSPDMMMHHQRLLAKLNAYLLPRTQLMARYPEADQSIPARYARAIAFYRQSRVKDALALMDGLLMEAPDDPFFLEQKARILSENGRSAEALPLYQRALDLAPREPLIRMGLAEAQLQWAESERGQGETAETSLLESARAHLAVVIEAEPKRAEAYRLMAMAYVRQGNRPMASLFKAEQSLAEGRSTYAKSQAERALQELPAGSIGALRAAQIRLLAEQRIDEAAKLVDPVGCSFCDFGISGG